MFVVVPIAENDGILFVVELRMYLGGWAKDERCPKAVGGSTLSVSMNPVRSKLARFVRWNDIGEFFARRDTAMEEEWVSECQGAR